MSQSYGTYLVLVASLPLSAAAAAGVTQLQFADVSPLSAGLLVSGSGAFASGTTVAALGPGLVTLNQVTIAALAAGADIAFSQYQTMFPAGSAQPAGLIAQWQQQLADAYDARHKLMTGKLPRVVMYNAGEGGRSVTYTKTDIGALESYIAALETRLRIRRRRPVAVRF